MASRSGAWPSISSAFYPTSGGQPHDLGQLVATARSGAELTAEIVGVEEDEHGEVWHHTAKPLGPGTTVRGIIDRERRLDHIQQHSGQHLLSAAFIHVCGAPTVSFHLGEMVSTIDLAMDNIADRTLQQVEELANRIIAEDRPVTVSTVSRAQAETWLAAGELRKLPPREGELRVIQIAGKPHGGAAFDRNACGGTHVHSTGQIGGLHLRGLEKVRLGWRVEFVCGLRAARAARGDFNVLTEAGQLLSVGLTEVPEAIRRLQVETKQAAKQIQAQISDVGELSRCGVDSSDTDRTRAASGEAATDSGRCRQRRSCEAACRETGCAGRKNCRGFRLATYGGK